MGSVANLCALAGMNRVRDRLSWPELEPKKGEFAATNRYDWSVQAQSAAGLQVLQVGHHSPAWANPNGKRFPLDLRDAYNFHRALAQRWQGEVGRPSSRGMRRTSRCSAATRAARWPRSKRRLISASRRATRRSLPA